MSKEMIQFDGGNVSMWLEQDSSIMLKAFTKTYSDPVEITSDEAREIAVSLMKLADLLDGKNG